PLCQSAEPIATAPTWQRHAPEKGAYHVTFSVVFSDHCFDRGSTGGISRRRPGDRNCLASLRHIPCSLCHIARLWQPLVAFWTTGLGGAELRDLPFFKIGAQADSNDRPRRYSHESDRFSLATLDRWH